MDKNREDQLAMCGRTNAFLLERETRIAEVPDAGKQAQKVTALYATVLTGPAGTAKRTREMTRAARDARNLVLALMPGLLGPLTRVATTLGDATAIASATLTQKQLRKLRPTPFLTVTQGLLALAKRADIAPLLESGYKLKAETLKPLSDAVGAFGEAQPKPRQTIDERVRAGEKLEGLVDTLMKEIRDLDEDMKSFVLLDPELYADYLQARKIIDTGRRGGGDTPPQA